VLSDGRISPAFSLLVWYHNRMGQTNVEVVCFSPGFDIIPEWCCLVESVCEDQWNERSRQRHHDHLTHNVSRSHRAENWLADCLVLCSGLLSQCHYGLWTDCQMIPPDKIDACRLDHLPNASLPQMVDSIVVGGSQVSTHATIMVRDNHSASAGWLHLVDSIFDLHTSRMARRL
jgi:hypothetical protein